MSQKYIWSLLRFCMGGIMIWAFFDKLFGLGMATTSDKAWLVGGSPTFGFLKFGTQGPLSSFFQGIAGNAFVDWAFMLGLLLIGLALFFGVMLKLAGYSGALLMFLMWLAVMPPEHHPFLDEHIIYLLIFLGLASSGSGNFWGLGKWWAGTELVKKYKFLK